MKILRACCLALCLVISVLAPFVYAQERYVDVARVIDGDTFVLADGRRVRFIGINAPEYKPWDSYEEPYGKEATDYLKKRLKGQQVRLESDLEPLDKYGRTLAYVFDHDGKWINEELVAKGYAYARVYKPNVSRAARLQEAQAAARSQGLGIWAATAQEKSQDRLTLSPWEQLQEKMKQIIDKIVAK